MTDCVIQQNALTGTFSPSGLTIQGRVSEVTINDSTWTPLPAIPLENRNAIGIQNSSGTEIKLNYDQSTVSYIGVKMGIEGERYYDITDSIPIYARAKPGAGSVTIIIEELA